MIWGNRRLLVIEYAGKNKQGRVLWKCKCDCGNFKIIDGDSLKFGGTKSCGCLNKEVAKERMSKLNLSHGETRKTREYYAWKGMRDRCKYPTTNGFDNYGGRGIGYCERWESYENFLEDMGRCPEGYFLDRIDNDGDYCKENCRWATRFEQDLNKRTTKFVTFGNAQISVMELAVEFKIPRDVLNSRILKGWPLLKALSKPVGRRRNKC